MGLRVKTKLALIIISILILTAVDLKTKNLAELKLKAQPGITVIDGFWEFEYVENRNIAFSLGSQIPSNLKQYIIIGIGIAALGFLGWFAYKSPKTKLTLVSIVLISAGAFGNLIDRIRNGYVVDFIHWYYKGFDWPVFNVADIYVTIGMIFLIIEFLFSPHYRENSTVKKS